MPLMPFATPDSPAIRHLTRAVAFYARFDQDESAIAEMTAGLLAMAQQVARIERAIMAMHEA